MATSAPAKPRYRLAIASRAVAAIIGSYAFAILFSFALSRSLAGPLGARDAVVVAQMAGFLAYAGAVIWAFSCASAARAWAGIAVAAAIAALWFVLAGGF